MRYEISINVIKKYYDNWINSFNSKQVKTPYRWSDFKNVVALANNLSPDDYDFSVLLGKFRKTLDLIKVKNGLYIDPKIQIELARTHQNELLLPTKGNALRRLRIDDSFNVPGGWITNNRYSSWSNKYLPELNDENIAILTWFEALAALKNIKQASAVVSEKLSSSDISKFLDYISRSRKTLLKIFSRTQLELIKKSIEGGAKYE